MADLSKDYLEISAKELNLLQDAFRRSTDEARKEARQVTASIARMMKSDLASAGKNSGDKLTRYVAMKGLKTERRQVFQGRDGIIRASKFSGGYVPTVVMGLDRELPVSRKATPKNPKPTSLKVWRGSEFGSKRPFPNGGRRFRPENNSGYWFYPAWKEIKEFASDAWYSSMLNVVRKWSSK